MIEAFVPSASTYAGDIDFLVNLIFWIVGFWFVLSELVFFYLIFRFRKREGEPGQYVTGEEKSQKRWITIPHILVLICDLVILVPAIKVWYDIKQDLPPAQAEVRVISQQWAWTFVHPGPDSKMDTADDITTVNDLLQTVVERRVARFLSPCFSSKAGRDSRTHHYRLVRAHDTRGIRYSMRRDLRRGSCPYGGQNFC